MLPSEFGIAEVYNNDFREVAPGRMPRMAWRCAAMAGFLMPMLQSRPLEPIQEHVQATRLQEVVKPDLYPDVLVWARYVRHEFYAQDRAEGESVYRLVDDDRDLLRAICEHLHGIVPPDVYAGTVADLERGPSVIR